MLKGNVAVVTGGTRGIGLAIVRKFLQNGAKVALFGSRPETVDKALEQLRAENADWEVVGKAPDLTDFAALERQNNEGVAATRQSAYDVTSAVKDNAYNILGELRDLQSVTEGGFSAQQKCCCEILRAIDGVNYNASINACEIKTAIHAEGEATRTLLQQQENQRLRDELAQSRAANNDYMQSQYILGQLGRFYQNPPCNPCGCGA